MAHARDPFDDLKIPINPAPGPAAPWDRQPGEPDRAFVAFLLYLESAPTVDAALADRAGIPLREIRMLAIQWRWDQRRAARAAALRSLERAAAAQTVANRAEELSELWDKAFELARESILAALARGEHLTKAEALRYLEAITNARQLLAGEPTSIQRLDLGQLSPEQAAVVRALVDDDSKWEGGDGN